MHTPKAVRQADAELDKNRLPILIERIRAEIFEENQEEIEGTSQELSERFGYLEPAQFGRDIGLIEDNLEEFGIDIERTRTNKKRYLRIYENKESPYHPLHRTHLSTICPLGYTAPRGRVMLAVMRHKAR